MCSHRQDCQLVPSDKVPSFIRPSGISCVLMLCDRGLSSFLRLFAMPEWCITLEPADTTLWPFFCPERFCLLTFLPYGCTCRLIFLVLFFQYQCFVTHPPVFFILPYYMPHFPLYKSPFNVVKPFFCVWFPYSSGSLIKAKGGTLALQSHLYGLC